MNKSNTDLKQNTVEWKDIDWRKVERYIFKLQKRIYKAVRCGNVKQARKLQKTLLRSWYNKLFSVRSVTQDNRGKQTASVDGVKSLTPKQKLGLAKNLKLTGKFKATRRVGIPKPGKDEKRPLGKQGAGISQLGEKTRSKRGVRYSERNKKTALPAPHSEIPTASEGITSMYDRALQVLVKAALEPEWEALFEPSSYGFRPGRCVQDAIAEIKDSIKHKAKYVLDADIALCFARINHVALLRKTGHTGKVRRQIKAWLKSGVIDKGAFLATLRQRSAQASEGTVQGGIISPLLANIALHGLEERIKQFAESLPNKTFGYRTSKSVKKTSLTFIRYANNFVVLHFDKSVVQRCREIISDWLGGIGLELKPESTRLTHTLFANEAEDGKAGFDFLGYHIQQHKASKYKTGIVTATKERKEFITLLTPSKKNQQNHRNQIQETVKRLKNAPQEKIIKELNPIIRGWSNYYSFSDSQTTGDFTKMKNLTYLQLRRWAKRKCDSGRKSVDKYWGKEKNRNWVFCTKNEKGKPRITLAKYGENGANSTKYVKVKGDKSPYDGDLGYWSSRLGVNPELSKTRSTLLKKHKGKCAYCGLTFKEEDIATMERDQITPKSNGG